MRDNIYGQAKMVLACGFGLSGSRSGELLPFPQSRMITLDAGCKAGCFFARLSRMSLGYPCYVKGLAYLAGQGVRFSSGATKLTDAPVC